MPAPSNPPHGRRLTGILPWAEANRPTYPVRPDAAEQAGYGPAQLAVPQHLKDVHDHLRAELTQVRDVVDRALVALVADEPGALQRLQRVVDLLTDTLLSHLAYEERELLHPLARFGFYR